ncbi:MAG TPA: glycosyltransferase family 39 protein [Casimicrobiaceae bacterium]|nr:glycosyltransferase family 39 protein [Casimicrobiaceae bacterium]
MLTAPGDATSPARTTVLPASLSRRAGWWLALYCAVLFFWNLGAAPLVDVDEGAFSEATREMLARGDFITTYLNGELRFDKPILTYWLQALPVAWVGPVEWAFRLPSALAACLWAWLLFRFARRFAPDSAAMATFMLASALGPLVMARAATADALLNAFIAGSLFAFYRHLADGRRRDLVAAFAWMALGVLTKGPVALAVPALAVALYCVTRREWLRPFTLLRDPLAWLVLLAIAAPWYALEYRAQGTAFVDGFLLKHNVNRFSGTMLGHGGYVWYYIVTLPVLVFPFLGPLAGALAGARAGWLADDVQRFAWCAFVVMFVFFSFSRTQLPHYLLYGMTPLFLVLAINRRRFGGTFALAAPALAGLAFAVAMPWLAGVGAARTGNALARLLLADFAATQAGLAWPAAVACIILAALLATTLRLPRDKRIDAQLYVCGAVPALFLVGALWPLGIEWFQAPVAAAGRALRHAPDVVEWNANWPSFSVYRDAVTPSRRPRPGETVLTRIDRVGELPPHEVVFARREVVVARVRP